MEEVKNLILAYTDEYRWVGDKFIIWVPWYKVHAFMNQLRDLIIIDATEDMDAQIQNDSLCIVLNRNLIDTWLLEKLFPKRNIQNLKLKNSLHFQLNMEELFAKNMKWSKENLELKR